MFARPNSHHSQIAYVTNDMEAAIARLAAEYGTPGFFEMSNIQPGEDPAGKPVLKIALAVVGGVEIELIEPVGDTAPLFSDVLPDREGLAICFHHIASRIEGPMAHWDAHVASLDLAAHPVVFEGAVGDMLRFIYTDERATLGHYVEHVWMSPDLLAQMGAIVPAYPAVENAA
ncbi:VOC family protein [Sphingobium sp.]|uniref:VOC family protein n=1 Tax=Sphingobium TaxID=165695 RepID=UPI001A28C55E|nr:VOC family protein [Sphingobium sp.]MBJ7377951.1 VOC family protein [Sphingobium sp.]